MSKERFGKKADDIFARKTEQQQETSTQKQELCLTESTTNKEPIRKEKLRRGRPQEHQEEWAKVTVVLMEKQIHWLDKLSLDIRYKTRTAVSRAEIIRSIISAMEESNIDLTQSKSEHELKELILSSLN